MKSMSVRKKIICFLVLVFEIILIYCVSANLKHKIAGNEADLYQQTFQISDLKSNTGTVVNNEYYIDETLLPGVSQEGEVFTFGPYASLYPGDYLVTLHYETNSDENRIRIYSNENPQLNFEESYALPADRTEFTFPVSLSEKTNDFEVQTVYMGKGSFKVHSLEIAANGMIIASSPYVAVIKCIALFLVFVLLDILLLYFSKNKKHLLYLALLVILTFILSAPLYTKNVISGHDIAFHLGRIYGIRDELLNGNFFVKLQPNWIHDYGYLVGVFYGDLFLYIPAVLSILGMSMMNAYKAFLILMTFGTAVIAYFSIYDMYKEQKLSLLGSILYTTGIYRLMDLYLRHSVGETLAMMFFPLIVCGINRIYRKEENRYGWLILSAGLFGMIHSHVLSCEMVCIFLVLFFLINMKSTLQGRVLKQLLLSGGVTLLSSLGFIVPFLEFYFRGGLKVMDAGRNAFSLNDRGIVLAQLLDMFVPAEGINQGIDMGIAGEMPLTIGFALVCGLFVALVTVFLVYKKKSGNTRKLFFYLGFGMLSIYMSTIYFPWDSIRKIPFLENAVSSIQFPWRFLALATVFAVFAFCESLTLLKQTKYETYLMNLSGVVVLVAAISAMYFISGTNRRDDYIEFDSEKDINLVNTGDEYLPIGTDIELFDGKCRIDGDLELNNYSKQGCRISADVRAKEDSVLEVPLIYYKYYQAKIADTLLEVYSGENNVVAIKIPGGVSGTLRVKYATPIHWCIAYIVSIITIFASFGYWGYDRLKNRNSNGNDTQENTQENRK